MSFKNTFLTRDNLNSLTQRAEKTLLEPQYSSAYEAWKQDDSEENRDNLLRTVAPLIDYHANASGGADKNYLTIQGKILAMKAMKNYDPARSSLTTYLGHQLAPLRRFARQQMNILSVPERTMMAAQQLESAETELEDELGRAAADDELADKMGISVNQIAKIRKSMHARNTGSYETPEEEGSRSSPSVRRTVPEEYLHDYVLSALDSDPVSKLIYENDNRLNGRRTLPNKDLAAALRISAGAVSQRRLKILEIINNANKMLGIG